MDPYAIIETGGKQYRVEKGHVLNVERLGGEPGENIQLERVLALSDGDALTVGAPEVEGAKVTAKVVEHLRGAKVVSFKKKRRKGYKRKIGHRQELTRIEIVEFGASGPAESDEPAEIEAALEKEESHGA